MGRHNLRNTDDGRFRRAGGTVTTRNPDGSTRTWRIDDGDTTAEQMMSRVRFATGPGDDDGGESAQGE